MKGTTIGMITGVDGDFELEVPKNAVLQVSYIGYIPQEVAVGSKTSLNIILSEDTQNLDEIVVVAYGTSKKSALPVRQPVSITRNCRHPVPLSINLCRDRWLVCR